MDSKRLRAIEALANELLTSHEMFSPRVPIFDLMDKIDIQWAHQQLPNYISGASMIDKGTKVVTINSGHSENRQRFTAAHEIGHILLHNAALNLNEGTTAPLFRNEASSQGFDINEVEANHFAACLLMPKALIEQEIEKLCVKPFITESTVTSLASTFGVSEVAMSIRLSKLNYL